MLLGVQECRKVTERCHGAGVQDQRQIKERRIDPANLHPLPRRYRRRAWPERVLFVFAAVVCVRVAESPCRQTQTRHSVPPLSRRTRCSTLRSVAALRHPRFRRRHIRPCTGGRPAVSAPPSLPSSSVSSPPPACAPRSQTSSSASNAALRRDASHAPTWATTPLPHIR